MRVQRTTPRHTQATADWIRPRAGHCLHIPAFSDVILDPCSRSRPLPRPRRRLS